MTAHPHEPMREREVEEALERMRGRLYRFTGLVPIELPARRELVAKIDADLLALQARLRESERAREEIARAFNTEVRVCTARTKTLQALEQERDSYRFWNERVRVCEHHTQDIAAPVGDCLVCNIQTLEEELEKLR